MERPDHRMRTSERFLLIVVLALSIPPVWCQQSGIAKPSVAYSHKGVLYLASESGQVLRAVETKPPVGVFVISPDGQTVVFAPFKPKEYGGRLYRLSLMTGQTELLTHGPYFNKWPGEGGPEVYDDPDFSPDGKRVVFAIHGQATGDIVEASGPLAVMDLGMRKMTLVRSTLTVNGAGQVAYANRSALVARRQAPVGEFRERRSGDTGRRPGGDGP